MATTLPFGSGTSAPQTIPFGGQAQKTTPQTSSSLGNQIWASIANTFNSGAQNLASGVDALRAGPQINGQDIKDAYSGGGLGAGIAEGGAQVAKAGVSGIANLGKAVGGFAQAAGAPLFAATSAIANPIGNAIGNSVSDSAAMSLNATLKNNPAIGQNASDISNIANLAVPEITKGASPAISTATDALSSGIGKAKESIIGTPEEQAVAQLKAKTQAVQQTKAETAAQIKKVADEWKKPTLENKASFNKARQTLAQAPDTTQFLAEQGISPNAHIEDGKFNTEDTAQQLRDTAGKMSRETLRPSLQMADYTTAPTPIADIQKAAIQAAQKTPEITPGNMTAVISTINKEAAALKTKYPDGMTLTEMHDNKITYSKNSGYSPVNDPKVNNSAIAQRSISSTLASLVVTKAPQDLPVGEFNAYLSKYYKAADYLDTLQNKTAPVSKAQAIARGVAKFGGAALVRHFIPGGGELVSSFAGYQIGKALEHAAENFTTPMKDAFLKNLEVTNPEAFSKVQKFMSSNSKQLALPPASSIQLGAGNGDNLGHK